jgi:hypothetical protein
MYRTMTHVEFFQPESEAESSNDENSNLSNGGGASPPQLLLPQQPHPQLLHPLLQHHHQLARVAFGRLASNGVSVIQKVGRVPQLHRPPPASSSPPPPLKQEPDPLKIEEEEKVMEMPDLVPVSRHPAKITNRYR